MSRQPNRAAQRALADFMGQSLSPIRDVYVNRKVDSDGVSLHIVSAASEKEIKRDAEKDAADVYTALLSLPPETRNALQLIIHENVDLFCGAGQSKSKRVHPWPPKSRGHE